jgi:phosphoglucosamine mutase
MPGVGFGTDGIRYIAGKSPLDPETAGRIGRALGRFVLARSDHPVVVIGRDTRPSGTWLAGDLESGLLSEGIDVISLGIMTTPGVAYLTRRQGADLGISVSASHNPVEYNGIKLVGYNGLRLQREEEIEIESLINESAAGGSDGAIIPGQRTNGQHLIELYIEDHIRRCPAESLEGLKVVVDCANGAASRVAPEAFTKLGAEVTVVNAYEAGKKINHQCGSEHVRRDPQDFISVVRQHGVAYGFAFDGDGDRLVVVDANGCLFNGDDVLFALATYFHSQSLLRDNVVITTHMANTGLEEALDHLGIKTIRTGKGDKALEAEMWHGDYLLGGEQTGNIIVNDGHHTAADAIYTALFLSGVLCNQGVSLSEMVASLQKRPQVLASTRLLATPSLERMLPLQAQKKRSLAALGDDCRIMTWYSSTEPGLFRVMLEGNLSTTVDEVRQAVMSICQVVREATRSVGAQIVVLELSTRHFG